MSEKVTPLQILGYVGVGVLVLNIILFAIGYIGNLIFWMVILVMAFFAYIVVPKLRMPGE
ncbi:MAG: hypothetical protein QF824_06160 [Candidatus Woesearchaeota archaeon]|mgnify:CR=1 FL=1|jgi:hypothetical protein|nr:hypothetical protein [Candidatus Woesearchaeota archaeon]|tara:strand:- start:254 stop:433 length:180 start_codon:yes stop_codon:yes gene_type:complete